MKALILGGYGIMGSSVARDLVKSEELTEVILADRCTDMTNVHESVRSSKKVSTQVIDVTDFQTLVSVIKGKDVVINCVGPYYRYGIHTMQAAIEAGTNYLDICDDYDVTIEAFALDEAAKEAGVSLCVGFGGGPGTTNMLAKYAADKLDEVSEIRVLWVAGLNDLSGPGALAHGMHMFSGNVPEYIDGELVNVPAGSGIEEVEFLDPTGKCEVCYVGHPEPITLPRYIGGVKTVINKGGLAPAWANRMVREFTERGFASMEPLKFGDASIAPRDLIVSVMQNSPVFKRQVEQYTLSPANIVVKGKEGGYDVTYTYALTGRMAPGTAIPASIFTQMLCRGEIKVKGVVAPEAAVDPKAFFAWFSKRGLEIMEQKTVIRTIQL